MNDPNGCKGNRLSISTTLEDNLELLKGLDQSEIVELLGKPDRNELYKRNQKFFYYQITPAEDCAASHKAEENSYLSIRFSATGFAREVLVYKEPTED